jgi:hypothetical protein
MSNKDMTAVEFAVEKLAKFIPSGNQLVIHIILNQAKEMEKQQMWNYIETNYVIGENSLLFHKQEFEQYYNETYGGQENEQ